MSEDTQVPETNGEEARGTAAGINNGPHGTEQDVKAPAGEAEVAEEATPEAPATPEPVATPETTPEAPVETPAETETPATEETPAG